MSDALWALRTTLTSAIGFSPYSLVHRFDDISPVEITIRTARVSAINDLEWDAKSCSSWPYMDLKALEEKKAEVEKKMTLYHKAIAFQ